MQIPSNYELLAQCIRSDQLSAKQVQKVLKDEEFARWYTLMYGVLDIDSDRT